MHVYSKLLMHEGSALEKHVRGIVTQISVCVPTY